MSEKKKVTAQYSSLVGIHRAVPIILFAVAVFTMFCFITQDIGIFGPALSTVFLGLFSYGAYAIPLLLALHAIFYPSDIKEKRVVSRIIFSLIAITFISALSYSITYWNAEISFTPGDFFRNGQASVGGGFIGGIIGFGLMNAVGRVGVVIIAVSILAIYVSYFFASGKNSVSRLFYNILKYTVIALAYTEKGIKALFRTLTGRRRDRLQRETEEKYNALTDDDFFAVANGLQRLSVAELGIKETHVEGSPTLHDKVFYKSSVTKEEAERMDLRDKVEEYFYNQPVAEDEEEEEPTPARRRIIHTDFGDEGQDKTPGVKNEAPVFEASAPKPKDEGADAVFTQNFDPFSIMMSEELASKPSSRSLKDEAPRTAKVTEDISNLTEAEIERERRIAEFERRKAAIIETRRAIPVDNDGEFRGTPKAVDFHERNDESLKEKPIETGASSFTFDKAEKTAQTAKTAPESYTSGGFGYNEEPTSTIFSKPAFTAPETIYSYNPPKETAREYTVYTSGEAQKTEPIPASSAYVEEPVTQIFEKKQTASYTPEYSSASAPTSTVTESVADRDEREEAPVSSFTMATAQVEETEFVPQFKPYQVAASEPEETDTEEENVQEIPTLKVEREYVGDVGEDDLDEDDTVDESEYEQITPPEDEGDGFEEEEIPPEERNPVVQGYKDMFSALREEEPEEEEKPSKPASYELVSPDEVEEDEEPPFEVVRPVAPTRAKAEKKPEPAVKKGPDFSHYQTPPVSLLGLDPVTDDDTSEINENTKILIDTLASFNVTASIKGVDRGPRITRYEVVPARGVKVNSITQLFNDICLNLAKEGIRMEAPIPGKSAIGFEIPNQYPKNVRLRELLECDEFINAKSKTFVAIGKDVAGNPIFGDISKYPHALICGATGMGKSVCINSILISMLYRARPDEIKLIMVDPKKVEFKMYSGIPHLLIPVITESKQAAGALMWAVEEMERRYELIEKFNVRNLDAYNEKVTENPSLGEKLPKIVIVIDELADLMMMVRDPVEDLIMRIAQKARAAGIHLIIGTQRPSVQVITGSIKANIPTRMSCKVTSQVDSRTVFDTAGAEKLLNRGDMLYSTTDRPKAFRVQGAFVSDSEVESIMEFLKSQTPENSYDDEVFAEINKAAQKCGNKKSGGVSADDFDDDGEEVGYYSDQQFLDAVELAIRSKKVSTSLLQRKLSIGYGKAAKYIDAMEDIGIVSEPNGQKPRDVLISMDEWHEKLSRVDVG